jgi:hypothetical protein
MTTNQFYFVLLVIASFAGFGLAVAISYARYRRWLASSPIDLSDHSRGDSRSACSISS